MADPGDSIDWPTARQVCTQAELDALELHETMGYKRMAVFLGLSVSSVRGRVDRAKAKIRRDQVNDEGALRGGSA